jgi:hypothetical protein
MTSDKPILKGPLYGHIARISRPKLNAQVCTRECKCWMVAWPTPLGAAIHKSVVLRNSRLDTQSSSNTSCHTH